MKSKLKIEQNMVIVGSKKYYTKEWFLEKIKRLRKYLAFDKNGLPFIEYDLVDRKRIKEIIKIIEK